MKLKIFLVFFLGIGLSVIIVNAVFAAWPAVYVPAIEGSVLDATTGDPIENAIIEATWETSVYAFVDRTSGSAGYKLLATGKDGKYRLPAKIFFQPLGGFISSFRGIDIKVRHPLYESKSHGIDVENIKKYSKEGKLKQWDFKVLKLEEKFSTPESNFWFDSELRGYWVYFILAKKINIRTENNKYVEEIEKLIKRFPNNENYNLLENTFSHIKEEMKKIGD